MFVNVLFLAHCTREKGIFAAAESVLRANHELAARKLPMELQTHAPPAILSPMPKKRNSTTPPAGRAEFGSIIRHEHLGFVSGAQKEKLLRDADLFLFPTRYLGENQPVNLIEAMAFGLPIVTTRWRSLPGNVAARIIPAMVNDQDPDALAAVILDILGEKSGELVHRHFTGRFTLQHHLTSLAAALRSVESPG